MFLSERPHIRDEVGRCFIGAIMIAVIPTTSDIERYLEIRLDRDPAFSVTDHNLRAGIMRVIQRKISRMCVETVTLATPVLPRYLLVREYRFLLVSLNIDAVLEEAMIHRRGKELDEVIRENGLGSGDGCVVRKLTHFCPPSIILIGFTGLSLCANSLTQNW